MAERRWRHAYRLGGVSGEREKGDGSLLTSCWAGTRTSNSQVSVWCVIEYSRTYFVSIPTFLIGVVANVIRVENIHEGIWAIINRKPKNRDTTTKRNISQTP